MIDLKDDKKITIKINGQRWTSRCNQQGHCFILPYKLHNSILYDGCRHGQQFKLSDKLQEKPSTLRSKSIFLSFPLNYLDIIAGKQKEKRGFSIPIGSSSVLSRMRNGDKSLKNFHLHIRHQRRSQLIGGVPVGCLPIKVGRNGEEEERFVVPVMYFNHPLFSRLLKASEEEYGFDQKGTLSIPCLVEEFRSIKDEIDGENILHHHHGSHHFSCFKV